MFLIKSNGGHYWNGRAWVSGIRKAEVYCSPSEIYHALVLMNSDDNRAEANTVGYPEDAKEAYEEIRVQYRDDTYDLVHKSTLDGLITSQKIRRFLRYSEGWVTLGMRPVRRTIKKSHYTGQKRRRGSGSSSHIRP
jgi:hypothetical protein